MIEQQRSIKYCSGCGRLDGMCEGKCILEFDARRFCPYCGKRLAVTITTKSVRAKCIVDGEIDIS